MSRLFVFGVVAMLGLGACDAGTAPLGQLEGQLEAPDLIDFGEVQVGLEAVRELTLSNRGDGPLTIERFEEGPDFAADDYDFELEVEDRPLALQPGQSASVAVRFFATRPRDAQLETFVRMVLESKSSDIPRTFTVTLRSRPVPSGLRVQPEPVDFGPVLRGSSRTLDVTITNLLALPTGVFTRVDSRGRPDIRMIGGGGRFELLSDYDAQSGSLLPAGRDLGPEASVTARLRFVADVDPTHLDPDDVGLTPRDGIANQAVWVIANCPRAACERRVDLFGTSSDAALECSPGEVDFGAVSPGVRISRRVSCRNVADQSVTILGWSLGEASSPGFDVAPPDDSQSSLEPGRAVTFEVGFRPATDDLDPDLGLGSTPEGTVEVRARNHLIGRDLDPVVVRLRGRVGSPRIAVVPRTLSFGPVAIGTRATRRILIQNTGFGELVVGSIRVDTPTTATGAFRASHSILALEPGQSQVIEMTFEPLDVGPMASELIVLSNDDSASEISVPLAGEGVSLPPCTYRIAPPSLEFGIVQVMRSTTQVFRIDNLGADECLIARVETVPGSSDGFSLAEAFADPTMLAPGASATVRVEYRPFQAGLDEGAVGLYVSDPGRSNPTVALLGAGSDSALLITPDELDFGEVGVACSTRDHPITIYNTGSATAVIDSISLSSGVSSEFRLHDLPSSSSDPSSPSPGALVLIAPGQSTSFSVSYSARDRGFDLGTVEVQERGRARPYVIPLHGEGAPDPWNEDTFTQLETPLVDILFVIDNSCSMQEEQSSLAQNFSSFMRFADAHRLDYQISVVSTDVDGSFSFACPDPLTAPRPVGQAMGACGYFADGTGAGVTPAASNADWRIISPREEPSATAAFSAVAMQGITGSGTERGLQAAYQALSSPLITGFNVGFLRPEAYLALIFVSDEEDQSSNSVDFYVNYFRAIKGVRNANRFSASAIVGPPDDPLCASTADPGQRYVALARETGGIHESICTQNWASSLEALGQSAFGYKTKFFLSNQPLATSLEVAIDGTVIAPTAPSGQRRWSYDREINAILFEPLAMPEPGSEIVVRYRAECL